MTADIKLTPWLKSANIDIGEIIKILQQET